MPASPSPWTAAPHGSPPSAPSSFEATTLWARIRDTPPARRLDLILGDPRYHTWAITERFLEAAAKFNWLDTPSGLHACRLALAIAERLPAPAYPAGLR